MRVDAQTLGDAAVADPGVTSSAPLPGEDREGSSPDGRLVQPRTPDEQLALVEIPAEVKLTPRQTRALELVQAAGRDGIHADELGALLHAEYRKHSADARCRWCGATGQDLLKALRAKGLVRYRRGTQLLPGYWQATGNLPPDVATDVTPGAVPYNEFPPGF